MRVTMNKFNKKIKTILSSELWELVGDLAFPMEPMQGFAGCNQFRRNNRWSGWLSNLSQQLEVIAASDMEQHYCQVDGWVGLKLN